MPDDTWLAGAPANFELSNSPAAGRLLDKLRHLPDASLGEDFYVQYGAPWLSDDPNARLRTMSEAELGELFGYDRNEPPGSMFARFGGSPFFETRMADLRGVRDRRYLDATATHKNREPEDIARHGILVEFADAARFGPHSMFPEDGFKPRVRPSDEAMYALGLKLYSLQVPPSPHAVEERTQRGAEIFDDEGCAKCHTPPLYTNDKLIAAPGFAAPEDAAQRWGLEVSPRRVHTDPGLALKTRKGTGYYKVPSLRGVWYRGLYGQSSEVASLEDWFDPARLREDYVRSGWRAPGVQTGAVVGHDFGLDLAPEDKRALLAFVRTL